MSQPEDAEGIAGLKVQLDRIEFKLDLLINALVEDEDGQDEEESVDLQGNLLFPDRPPHTPL